MSLVLSVCSLKGGSGRTTVATNLAVALAAGGHRVSVVDADPDQGSALAWGAVAGVLPVVAAGPNLRRTVDGLADAAVVVIDGPPRLDRVTRDAMLVAHYVIAVTVPGPTDGWALRQTVTALGDAQKARPDLRGGVLFNRVERTTLSRMARRSVDDLGTYVFDAALSHRVGYAEALLNGAGVVTYDPGGEAAREVGRFVRELLKEIARGKE